MRVARYRFARTLRNRRTGYLSIVLLIGLIGGIAMGSIGAARRTQGSYTAFLASTFPSDLSITVFPDNPYNTPGYSPAILRTAQALPGVIRVDSWIQPYALPLGANGAPRTDLSNITVLSPLHGQFETLDRVTLLEGRLANPARLNEFVVTPQGAQIAGWHVGQRIPFGFYSAAQISAPGFKSGRVAPLLHVEARLVGLVQFNTTIVQDQVDEFPTFALFTPAVSRFAVARGAESASSYVLKLAHPSVAAVAKVERQFLATEPPGFIVQLHVTSGVEAQVDRALKPESIALALFGAIAALAALGIAAQAIGRQLWMNRDDSQILRALGAGPATTLADGLVGVLGSVVLGALVAVGVAVALSPIAPIGPVRPVYPTLGFATDWTVLGIGLATLVALLGGLSFLLAYHWAPTLRREDRDGGARRRPTLTSTAAAAGATAPVVVGIDLALNPGMRRGGAPVRSAMAVAAIAVVVVVTTVTFGSSLQTLVSTPRLYGWNWSYALGSESGPDVPPQAVDALRHDPDVAAWSGAGLVTARINGLTVPAIIENTGAAAAPPITAGGAVRAKNQIVLGAQTMAALHTHIGATVTVGYGSPKDAPLYVPPTTVRVVGTATMPAIGFPGLEGDHTSMGNGAVMARTILPASFEAALLYPYPVLNGPEFVFVRLRPSVSRAAGLADMQRVAGIGNRAFARAPNGAGTGDTVSVFSIERPAEIVNYRSTGSTPLVLATGLALGAVAALGLTLVSSVRRRRRDLAVLRTLGFTQRQLAGSVAVQATTFGLVGLVVGLPLGIALGRWVWVLFADQIGAVAEPTVPVVWTVVIAVATLVLVNLVAALPARAAARTPAALVLRGE